MMGKERWWEKELLIGINYAKHDDFVFDSRVRAEKLKNIACSQAFTYCVSGHLNDRKLYFKTGLAKRINKDQLGEFVPELHEKEIKVIVYFNVHTVEPDFAEDHPDWQQIKEDGRPKVGLYEVNTTFCVNTPWREWVFQALRDLAKYEIDGVFYDGPIFFDNTCYCRHCQEKFRRRYGRSLPPKSKRNHPDWPLLVEFQSNSIADFLEDSQRTLKELNPDILFYMNGNGLWSFWPTGRDNRKIIQYTDLLLAEGGFIYRDLTKTPLWKPGATAKLLGTQASGKPISIGSAMIHKPWGYVMLPKPEARLLYAETIANGANLNFAFLYGLEAELEPEIGVLQELNLFLRRNAQYYLKTESAAEVALIWSMRTANFHQAVDVPDEDFTRRMKVQAVGNPIESNFGFYEMLFRSHIPFDIIDEPVLAESKLDRYDVLIFPNSTCLSGEDTENVRRYVKQGGNVIATFETSICDRYGEKQNDFQLSDLFGVTSENQGIGPLHYGYVAPTPASSTHNFFKGLKRWLPAPKYGIKVTPTTGKRLMEFCEKQPGLSGSQKLPTLPPKPDPFMIVNECDKGTCVYLAGNLGEEYWNYKHPQYRRLIESCVNRLSGKLITLEDAPSSLEVVVRRQIDPPRQIVHLINFTGEMTRPIQRIIPCRNLKVILKGVKKASKVKALWSGKKIEYNATADQVSFTVPLIDEYEAVVIEEEENEGYVENPVKGKYNITNKGREAVA